MLKWYVSLNEGEDVYEKKDKDLCDIVDDIIEKYGQKGESPYITKLVSYYETGEVYKEPHDSFVSIVQRRIDGGVTSWIEDAEEEARGQEGIESDYRSSISLN